MAEKIIMPKTGMAMEEGMIIEWKVAVGQTVEIGDVLAEIETDKSTMELESDAEGVVLALLYEAGATVPVTLPIAWIGSEGETIPEEQQPVAEDQESQVSRKESVPLQEQSDLTSISEPSQGRIKATPAARALAAKRSIDLGSVEPTGRYKEVRKADVMRLKASPLATRIASEQGISLPELTGSGHDGKILSTDLLRTFSPPARRDETTIELNNIRRITGKRMTESIQTIPQVTIDMSADVTELLELRKRVNEELSGSISINDLVMFALVRALKTHRRFNSRFEGRSLAVSGSIHLGMAVATERGLLVPVIRDAQALSLTSLSVEARRVATGAREGSLPAELLQGSTFSISNLGMYSVTSFTPIINPPEAGILGVCGIEEVLRRVAGQIVDRKVLRLSLTFDHRVADGADASVFLKAIVENLESPYRLILQES